MPWLPKGEAARALGISPGTLARRIDHGKLKVRREDLQVRVHVPQDQIREVDTLSPSQDDNPGAAMFRREPEPGGRLARLVTSTPSQEDRVPSQPHGSDEGRLPPSPRLAGQAAVAVAAAALVITGWVGWQYRAASQAHLGEMQDLRNTLASHNASQIPVAVPSEEVLEAEARQVDRRLSDLQSRWSVELAVARESLEAGARALRGTVEADRETHEATLQSIQRQLSKMAATLDAVIRTQDQLACDLEKAVVERDQALAERTALSEEIEALRVDLRAANARPTLREIIDQDWDVRQAEEHERTASTTVRDAGVPTR
ncbi:MAG: hypothetical protein JSU63_15940 [Phycisphaerales bacterium]|nr:MAG: hypothetical protein JSU63_15940 [Phycisphaerales bacterium]